VTIVVVVSCFDMFYSLVSWLPLYYTTVIKWLHIVVKWWGAFRLKPT